MVLRNSDVVINIRSRSQEKKLRSILNPTEKDIQSDYFKERVNNTARGFIEAEKNVDNLIKATRQ